MSDLDTWDELPPRLQKVARHVSQGIPYADVAEELGVSERTVEHYAADLASRLEKAVGVNESALAPKERIMVWWHVDGPGSSA